MATRWVAWRVALLVVLVGSLAACGRGTAQTPGTDGGDGSEADGGGADGGGAPDAGVETCAPVTFESGFATVPIHVADSAGVARRKAPVSGGVPFARGALRADAVASLVLADSQGCRVRSFQTPVVLGSWGDGSVKWLLLDFEATLAAGGSAAFALGQAHADTAGDPAIRIVEDADAFTIDTGALKAVLSKRSFAFLSPVWVDANGNGDYADDEKVVGAPGEMFVDLDDAAPGAADSGALDYPDVWYSGMEGGNWLRDSQATSASRYLASGGDYSVTQFRAGRTHVVFKLEGWHANATTGRKFAKYTLYLHFWAGKSSVRASHTWIMTGDPDKNFVRRMAIDLPLATAAATVDYAAGGPYEKAGTPVFFDPADPPFTPLEPGPSEIHTGTVPTTSEVSLVAVGPDKHFHNVPMTAERGVDYSVAEGASTVAGGRNPSGWLDVSDGALGAAVGVKDFWREHPKETQFANGRLAAFLWPDHGEKALDLRRRYPEVRGSLSEGWGKAARREFNEPGSAVGVAKTTDLFFYFHAGTHEQAAVDDEFRSFQEPLVPYATPEHNVATGVWGPLTPYDPIGCRKLENYLDLLMARIVRSGEEYHWFGMMDLGDHLFEFGKVDWELDVPSNPNLFSNWGYAGWMQEHNTYGQFLAAQYLRSGRPQYFRAFDRWLRHARDVDCVYWDTPDDGTRPTDNENGGPRKGGGHRHDQQHWGTYMASYGIPSIALVHHYFLTGEGRDLDAMRDNADWLVNAGRYYENYGVYSALYTATALGDPALAAQAFAQSLTPSSSYGRATYDSGMGLMLYDVHTGGDAAVRAKLRTWADLNETSASFLRAYLEAQEATGTYLAQLRTQLETTFPASAVRASNFSWAPRAPTDFQDLFGAEIMPDGPWEWPLRAIERALFDDPSQLMGNDLRGHATQMALMWHMPVVGCGP